MKNRSLLSSVDTRSFYWAVGLSVVGCFLLVASLFIPPMGVIDATIISAAGLVFTFSGAIVGINGNFNNKLAKFEFEMEDRYRKRDNENEDNKETPTD